MPELPEVETTCRGIAQHICRQTITNVFVRQPRLRWPVAETLPDILIGQTVLSVQRRAKYLLLTTQNGTLLIHLGMSGSLRVVTDNAAAGKHDHIDIVFADSVLRFNDPRRFGAVLWTSEPIQEHTLLRNLGPEPLLDDFDGTYLYMLSRNRKVPVKLFIMDSHNVVGVGNIYANEALFMAGIDPKRHAGRIALARYERLAECIRTVLTDAITQGGTTLRDFVNSDGKPGYFQQQLRVYGRSGLPCRNCEASLSQVRLANRSTVFCRFCQR